MEKKLLGKSKEDYLETVHILNETRGWCREVDIARKMGFSAASVSVALVKLENEGYLVKEDSGEIRLTSDGEQIARMIFSKHSFFKELFVIAGIDQETAEKEACLIEHSISSDSFLKLQEYIKHLRSD